MVENPVFSVLYLIFSFLGICGLLIFLGADYLAILFVLVYGGAISILIMFVVMMLDLKELELRGRSINFFFKYIMFLVSVCFTIFLMFAKDPASHIPALAYYHNWFKIFEAKTNIEVVGLVLYNHYVFQFIFMGFILFISMVVIISLVIRKQQRAKSQVLFKQLHETNLKMFMSK